MRRLWGRAVASRPPPRPLLGGVFHGIVDAHAGGADEDPDTRFSALGS